MYTHIGSVAITDIECGQDLMLFDHGMIFGIRKKKHKISNETVILNLFFKN